MLSCPPLSQVAAASALSDPFLSLTYLGNL